MKRLEFTIFSNPKVKSRYITKYFFFKQLEFYYSYNEETVVFIDDDLFIDSLSNGLRNNDLFIKKMLIPTGYAIGSLSIRGVNAGEKKGHSRTVVEREDDGFKKSIYKYLSEDA